MAGQRYQHESTKAKISHSFSKHLQAYFNHTFHSSHNASQNTF